MALIVSASAGTRNICERRKRLAERAPGAYVLEWNRLIWDAVSQLVSVGQSINDCQGVGVEVGYCGCDRWQVSPEQSAIWRRRCLSRRRSVEKEGARDSGQ